MYIGCSRTPTFWLETHKWSLSDGPFCSIIKKNFHFFSNNLILQNDKLCLLLLLSSALQQEKKELEKLSTDTRFWVTMTLTSRWMVHEVYHFFFIKLNQNVAVSETQGWTERKSIQTTTSHFQHYTVRIFELRTIHIFFGNFCYTFLHRGNMYREISFCANRYGTEPTVQVC